MNRWWIRKMYGLPSWLTDGAVDPELFHGLPVVWESPGGPGGAGGGGTGSGDPPAGSGDPPDPAPAPEEDPAKLKAKIAQLTQDLRATKQTASKVSQLEQQLAALTDKDKTDLEKANERATALEQQVAQANQRRSDALIRAAVDRAAREMGFIDEDVAFAMMDRSGVVVKEDDTVEGVREALTLLMTARPHLKKAEGDGGDPPSGKAPPPTPRKSGEQPAAKDPVRGYMDQRYGTKPAIAGARNGGSN
jgi:uncharacterized FlaG/YvyC family protein